MTIIRLDIKKERSNVESSYSSGVGKGSAISAIESTCRESYIMPGACV